jgi:hypothetical protein
MNSETELRRYMSLIALENMLRKKQLRLIRVDMFQDSLRVPFRKSRSMTSCLPSAVGNAMLMGESMAAGYPGAALPPTSKRHKADFRLP